MTRAAPGALRSFSIVLREAAFDESAHFRRVELHFGTQHEERILGASAPLDILPELTSRLDEPLGGAPILVPYVIELLVRRLPVSRASFNPEFRARKFVSGVGHPRVRQIGGRPL